MSLKRFFSFLDVKTNHVFSDKHFLHAIQLTCVACPLHEDRKRISNVYTNTYQCIFLADCVVEVLCLKSTINLIVSE